MWFLSPGVTLEYAILQILASLLVTFLILPFHEFAHGYVAYKFGDNTAKLSGRLSLNPLKHIDPLGSLFLLITGCFGWAKPVPINPLNFRHRRLGVALTALAGPVSNLLAALLGGFIFNAIRFFSNSMDLLVFSFFHFYIFVNVGLAMFNLVPLPPLDGSMILSTILPEKFTSSLFKNPHISMLIVFLLIFTNILSEPLRLIDNVIFNFIIKITAFPFGL